jgi:hypothetical protein
LMFHFWVLKHFHPSRTTPEFLQFRIRVLSFLESFDVCMQATTSVAQSRDSCNIPGQDLLKKSATSSKRIEGAKFVRLRKSAPQ